MKMMGGAAAFIAVALIAGGPAVRAQRGDLGQLETLTVPAAQLPSGCSLPAAPSEQVDGNRTRSLWGGLPISTNPWTGDSRATIAAIVERIGGMAPMPDGPPPDRRAAARFRAHLADDIERAYAAVYRTERDELLFVLATRYSSAAAASAAPRPQRRSQAIFGRTVVTVLGAADPCHRAITDHLAALHP